MLFRFAAIFRTEWKLQLLSRAFWLALCLAAGVPAGMFYFISKPWMSLAALGAGALPLALAVGSLASFYSVEVAGQCRRSGIASILWTKPFSSLEFVFARQLAAFLALSGILAMPAIVRWIFAAIIWQTPIRPAQDIWLLLYGAIPAVLFLSAVSIWTRTFFEHHIPAIGAALVIAAGFLVADRAFRLEMAGLSLDQYRDLVADVHPAFGIEIYHYPHLMGWVRTLVLSAFFTTLSALHLRRVERPTMRASTNRVWGFPTIGAMLRGLLPDPASGMAAISLTAVLFVASAAIAARQATASAQREKRLQAWARAWNETLPLETKGMAPLRLTSIDADVRIASRDAFEVSAHLSALNDAMQPAAKGLFRVNAGTESLTIADAQGAAVPFERTAGAVVVAFPKPVESGERIQLQFEIQGRPAELIVGGLIPFENVFAVEDVSLPFSGRQMDIASDFLLPVPATLDRTPDNIVLRPVPSSADYNIRLKLFGDLRALGDTPEIVAPDGNRGEGNGSDGNAGEYNRIEIARAAEPPRILAGPYRSSDIKVGGIPVRAHVFDFDEQIMAEALGLVHSRFERVGKVFGQPPLGRLRLIESIAPPAEAIPMRLISSELLASMKERATDFAEYNREAIELYQRSVDQISTLAIGGYFASGLQFEPAMREMRPALFQYLRDYLVVDDVRPTAPRKSGIFKPGAFDKMVYSGANRDWFKRGFYLAPAEGGPGQASPGENRAVVAYAFWRSIHYLLQDEGFISLLHQLVALEEPITASRLQSVCESVKEEPLDWFFEHWLRKGGLPRYEIVSAEASMVENESTGEIDYRVVAQVINRGAGRFSVPILVQTERDEAIRPLVLAPETTATLELTMPYRPELVVVDPDAWIAQEASWDPVRKTNERPLVKVKILEDEPVAASAAGSRP